MIPEIQIKILYFILNITFFPFFPFLPSIVIEWNKVDLNLWSAASLSVFKKNLLKFIKPSPSSVFNFHNCKGMKYFKRLHLGLSNLREHKFKHSFQGSLNSFCSCGFDVEQIRIFFFTAPCLVITEAAIQRCSVEKVFWKYAANLQENTHADFEINLIFLIKPFLLHDQNVKSKV